MRALITKNKGFTLIELAVVVLILGIAVASAAPLYTLYKKNSAIRDTQRNVEIIADAIGHFRNLNGRYPCPASLTDTREDTNFGRERCDEPGTPGPIFSTNAGSCTDGICVEQSRRLAFTYKTPVQIDPATKKFIEVTQSPRVLVGFIPFRQLNLRENQAFDGYQNRIMYVVTEHLAYAESFQVGGGGIEILNDQEATNLDTPASAHFLVFSYGENQHGAFTSSGVQLPCPADTLESHNCSFGNATYIDMMSSSATGSERSFDDKLVYFTRSDMPLWQYSGKEGHRYDIHNKTQGDVAINANVNDSVNKRLTVKGDVIVRDDSLTQDNVEGVVYTNKVCDSNAQNCFNILTLAGSLDDGTGGIKCPEGQFLVGISKEEAKCQEEVIARCPDGGFITGTNADGSFICTTPPQCPAENRTICGDVKNLQQSAVGITITLEGGSNYKEVWRCEENSGEAVWRKISGTDAAMCECTPGKSHETYHCDNDPSKPTYILEVTEHCNGGEKEYKRVWPEEDPCVCESGRKEDWLTCPNGQQGVIHRWREEYCDGTPPGPWTIISNSCKEQETQPCSPRTEERNLCPAGEQGWSEVLELNCATNTWEQISSQGSRDDCSSSTEPGPIKDHCEWTPRSAGYELSTGTTIELYSGCACGTVKTERCSLKIGEMYLVHDICACE